jgi:thiamine biosynthesis lipoprotein
VSAVHRFSHDAMNTTFEVRACHDDEGYASQAAHAAFELLDRLEQELSRFVPNSDVSRINDLGEGASARVSASTLECLLIARQLYELTAGAFDVSIGTGLESLELAPDEHAVRANAGGVRLDLGGIGKGFAVDRMAAVLEEWGIERALVHGGRSSVVALEPPPGEDGWTLTLRAGEAPAPVLQRLRARQRALSASGTRKREHILDPRTGQPVARGAVWIVLPRGLEGGRSPAAVAEGLSTAFMVLPEDAVAALCRSNPAIELFRAPVS